MAPASRPEHPWPHPKGSEEGSSQTRGGGASTRGLTVDQEERTPGDPQQQRTCWAPAKGSLKWSGLIFAADPFHFR